MRKKQTARQSRTPILRNLEVPFLAPYTVRRYVRGVWQSGASSSSFLVIDVFDVHGHPLGVEMLEIAYDHGAVALVARISGNVSDKELLQFGDALVTLDAAALELKRTPVTILVVIMSGAPPSAEQRRLMSELWRPLKAPLHVFALVSTSPVARGVMKVVQWLNPPGTKRREAVHGSFEDAARWAEKERREPIPALRILGQQLDRSAPTATARRA